MASFADRLLEKIRAKDSRSAGLDLRIDQMPAFIQRGNVCAAIGEFHELVLDAVADLVPAVKPQLAFFEQYGVAGIQAFENTVLAAKKRGLLVSPTASATIFLPLLKPTRTRTTGPDVFDCDAMTVTPYAGRDSLMPFVEACKKHGKGLFAICNINPGSRGL